MKIGFTLVELSIVLVIIGLLIGGILVGQSLIESSKLNAQVQQIQQFDIATNQFYGRFKGLPGDTNKITTLRNICPGDNNGFLDKQVDNSCIFSNTNNTWGSWNENANFFHQLSLTGFLKSKNIYNNNYTISDLRLYNDNQLPQSKLDNSWGFIAHRFGSTNLHVYRLIPNGGDRNNLYTTATGGKTIESAKTLALDNKIDDANALTGSVFAADRYDNTINNASIGSNVCNNMSTGAYIINGQCKPIITIGITQ